MSWSLKYLKKLQNEIEGYKDRMLYIINEQQEVAKQPILIRISQELDKLIISYQNFKRMLTKYQNLPYIVDFYMSTAFSGLTKDKLEVTNSTKLCQAGGENSFYIIEDENCRIIGIVRTSEIGKHKINTVNVCPVSFCNSGSPIWLAHDVLQKDKTDYLVVLGSDGNPIGVLERASVKRLCNQKTFGGTTRRRLYGFEEAFDHVPVSIFVLDKDLFIDYANAEAIRNFNEVLPRDYLFKKADLVFSGFLNNSYAEFIESEFGKALLAKQERCELEVKLLNYISLLANIKIVRKESQIENVVISFTNFDDLRHRIDELTFSADELSQALSLFLPYDIEKKLKQIPEYKEIYNYETKTITIISKIKDGGYWHVVNCLRVLSQIERMGILYRNNIDKEQLVRALMVHDVAKMQPDLSVGDVLDPLAVFEKSKLHALRSAEFARKMGFDRNTMLLVKYHHHSEDELPFNFPRKLIPAFRLLKVIDGVSAAITRRNATISFEETENGLVIHEENNERVDYSQNHLLSFTEIGRRAKFKSKAE